MSLLTSPSTLALWHDVIKQAENQCAISLNQDLEAYLASLLIRYSTRPEIAQQIFATAFLEAMQRRDLARAQSLQHVGDQCLLFAGFFPRAAAKKQVKISYFVDLGRSAYIAVSKGANDLYECLAVQFVGLMDILQSIRHHNDLLPLEAYEQWTDIGSKRALKILQTYTKGSPVKRFRQ